MSVSFTVTKDTFSPRLKEIEQQLNPTALKAIEKARDVYIPIQTPLVPVSDKPTHGQLLSSMNKTTLLNFGESVSLQFGFFAEDRETGELYAQVQEMFYPKKHIRYAGHTPTMNYFYEGLTRSKFKMISAIRDEFKLILR